MENNEQNIIYLFGLIAILMAIIFVSILLTIVLRFITRPKYEKTFESIVVRKSGPEVSEKPPEALLGFRHIRLSLPYNNFQTRNP